MGWVTDEVWHQLDPRAGQLAARTRRWLTAGVAVALVVAIGAGLAWHAGLLGPRLAVWAASGASSPGRFTVDFTVTNQNSLVPVRLVDAGQDGPGLALVEVQVPATPLPPGGRARITLGYEITDCAAVPEQPWPVPVRVDRWWGTQTVHVEPPSYASPGHESDEVQWQRFFVDAACQRP